MRLGAVQWLLWLQGWQKPLPCFSLPMAGWAYLGSDDLPGAGTQLVDLRLSDVSTLLGIIQLVLHLAVLDQVGVGLLLLDGVRGGGCLGHSQDTRLRAPHANLTAPFPCSHLRQPWGRPALVLCPRRAVVGTGTYRLLKLAFVALDLALQLVDQVLHPCQVLPVFLSLQVPWPH